MQCWAPPQSRHVALNHTTCPVPWQVPIKQSLVWMLRLLPDSLTCPALQLKPTETRESWVRMFWNHLQHKSWMLDREGGGYTKHA